MRYFIYAVIGIVAAAVIAGFFIVGSPQEERLRRFDERRTQDLQFLQSEIINYWVNKEELPAALDLLKDDIRGVSAPRDPETGAEYGYEVKGELAFSLCADFNLSNPEDISSSVPPKPIAPAGYYGEANWNHQAGSVCFDRKIDKDIYKPRKPVSN